MRCQQRWRAQHPHTTELLRRRDRRDDGEGRGVRGRIPWIDACDARVGELATTHLQNLKLASRYQVESCAGEEDLS